MSILVNYSALIHLYTVVLADERTCTIKQFVLLLNLYYNTSDPQPNIITEKDELLSLMSNAFSTGFICTKACTKNCFELSKESRIMSK